MLFVLKRNNKKNQSKTMGNEEKKYLSEIKKIKAKRWEMKRKNIFFGFTKTIENEAKQDAFHFIRFKKKIK
jgi:hypothetical protein